MKTHLRNRILSLVLAAVMVLGLFPAVSATPNGLRWSKSDAEISLDHSDRLVQDMLSDQIAHKPTDMVRVSIVLEDTPTIQAGYATMGIGSNAAAKAYDRNLNRIQKSMEKTISTQALDGKALDVVWNLTLVSNIISANVPYGRIDAIKAIDGVKDVVIERQYETTEADRVSPDMYTSSEMIGSSAVWQTGLTGAGSRVAIIDTGTDTDHQSFDNDAYLYALEQNAAAKNMTVEDYMASLDLLDNEEVASVLDKLNAYELIVNNDASEYRISDKLPFGANYVDKSLNVTHDYDDQGSHGSHVAGIAAANRYIPAGDTFEPAREAVHMCGVAPDAQIITLKVFGYNPGPYDSDYFAAIEDAIWLGCDSVNLSLGSGSPGFAQNYLFDDLLEFMATTDTVVVISSGNSGYWAETTAPGFLYADGVSFQTNGSPGSYTNAFTVASVDNDGTVGKYMEVAGSKIVYTETTEYSNAPMASLDTSSDGTGTEYDYIFVDGIGNDLDYEGIDLRGKVVFCQRGDISFAEKGNYAADRGAAAVVVCNNEPGVINMDLTDYYYSVPCVSILQTDAAAVKAASNAAATADGVTYYTGKVTIASRMGAVQYDSEYYTMSAFSSWGIPGSLELKPEITAPGGMIWSVNGMEVSGDAYEMMSGTSMAAPQITGMAALVAEYIRNENLMDGLDGYTARHVAQSLLMSTAQPLREGASGGKYYSILNQGAGLARVDLATTAESFITMDSIGDGKVKAELGDDPERTGEYSFGFQITNLNGEDLSYALSADVFTQDQFSDEYSNLYLDTWTRDLQAVAAFSVDGISIEDIDGFECDLNGDGSTDTRDADYLLEYLLGNETELFADGDVNSDGKVNSYDAHVLLTRQTGSFVVDVPANGTASVEVTLELTEQTKAMLDASYPTGAYIEAFVYAAPISDSEGEQRVTHSIPVLGYYGSWTEPSMYDVSSFPELACGAETRAPYLYQLHNGQTNFVSINYGDGAEYAFGGNPVTTDAPYLPERNAFNNQKGYILQNLRFTQIRNAANGMLMLSNAQTGEVYFAEELGQIESAYYHANQGRWMNTQYQFPLGLDLASFPEGTQLNISLVTAPEYNCWYDLDENGEPIVYTDWESLAEGAWLTTPVTIDNTVPVIQNVELGEENTLNVTASDNAYIAGVALMNADGTAIITSAYADQQTAGTAVTTTLDLDYVFGREFQVVVFDYAENTAVYEITLELDNERPYFTAIDLSYLNSDRSFSYTGLEADGTSVHMAPASGREMPRAVEYVEGAVYEITDDNKLYVGFDDDLFNIRFLSDLDPDGALEIVGFNDIAYNRADGRLYGLFYSRSNEMQVPYLCTIDLYTGGLDVLGPMPIDANTIAIDGNGQFYSGVYGENQLHTYTSDVTETGKTTFVGYLVGDLGAYGTTYINSMAWDHNTDELYWGCTDASFGQTALLKVDPATAALTTVCEYDFLFSGLYIAYETDQELFAPVNTVSSVAVSGNDTTLVNNSIQLSAVVKPWNVTNDAITWSSSNPAVATVDENGVVYGVSQGEAVITATSVLDPSKSASHSVTIRVLEKELKGVVWDEEGMVWWSSFKTNGLPEYKMLAGTTDANLPVNATMVANGVLYASTLDTNSGLSDLYTVDPETFEMTPAGGSDYIGYTDLAYGYGCGYGFAVYFNYIVLIDMNTGEYLGVWDWTEGLYADLVGITYYGSEYSENYGAYKDNFLLLDAEGNVYLETFLVTEEGSMYFNGPAYGYIQNIGQSVDYSYFQSFYFDGEFAYWARFNEADKVVELIAWDCEDTGNSYSLGYFPTDVWPVGGLYSDAEFTGSNTLTVRHKTSNTSLSNELMTSVELQELGEPKGSINAVLNTTPAVRPDSSVIVDSSMGMNVAIVEVTMPEDATNGIFTVEYDVEKLICLDVITGADVDAQIIDLMNGTVTVAFADSHAIPAGEPVAYLALLPLSIQEDSTEITVTTTEMNNDTVERTENFPVELPHICPSEDFVDVSADQWFHAAVDYVVSSGYMNGMDATHFGPGLNMNRAQFVTVLYRMEGEPEVTNTGLFTDVPADSFYTDAAYWALEAGITTGTGDGTTFNPNGKLSRTELVTFMYRYADYCGYDTASGDLSAYRDASQVLPFAVDAWGWAVRNGIVGGMTADTLAPMNLTNRAQAAVIFQRFDNTFFWAE